jgi:DNA-directed RNA polymerase specialized sigma subunit
MYEKALEDLWIWLMYRRGMNQTWIADRLGLTQSAISHRIKKMDGYFKKRISGVPPGRAAHIKRV